MLRTLFILTLLVAQAPVFTQAQATADKVAQSVPRISHPLPFKIGETLVYEVNFSKFIFSGTIGELKLWVSKAGQDSKAEGENPGLIELQAEAVSKGFFPRLFGLKVKDRFTSIVSPQDFGLHTSVKLIEEGKVQREQKSVINREAGRVTYIERDLATKAAKPKVKEAASPPWMQDLLSATYFVRTQNLNEGDVIPVPISDGGQAYNVEVIVGKREEIRVGAGIFNTIKLEVKAFDGRFVRRKGEMFVWVTDDASRTPVRARIKSSGATVTIDLKNKA
ncbi:MAG TPA: DUF3108 domain-containing protein [Blastocatellia bacterium]|nr:DUF3108 domain-containing protein [Blastocatellia bacterium]